MKKAKIMDEPGKKANSSRKKAKIVDENGVGVICG